MSHKAAKRLRQAQRAAMGMCDLDYKREITDAVRDARQIIEMRAQLKALRRRALIATIVRVLTFGFVKLRVNLRGGQA
jgi:hypothetical protein